MTLEQLRNSLPDYANDLKLNLSGVLAQAELNEQQIWGTALACAIAAGSPTLMAAISGEAKPKLSQVAFTAAQSAAALMGMNNVYFRFLHLMNDETYKTLPSRLRMNAVRAHGSDPVDFELWCVAVSAIHNCEACVGAHESAARKKGATQEQVLAAVRIASVLHAVASIIEAESAMAG